MLLFTLIYGIAEIVLIAVVITQFGFVLFTGNRNEPLLDLGRSVGAFIYRTIRYLTFNSDSRPFPFSPWPHPDEHPDG